MSPVNGVARSASPAEEAPDTDTDRPLHTREVGVWGRTRRDPATVPGPGDGAGPAIALRDVSVGYGGTTVLTGLSLEVGRGELVGIVGPSGSGKTTLLRLLTGRADRHHGEVQILGQPFRARGAVPRIGYVPQLEGVDWDFPLTVEQVVLLGDTASSAAVPWFSRAERKRARALLDRLGLAGLYDRRLRELSGGQRQRMFLARALVRRCELLLLDEPTSGVDLATRRDVLATLGDLNLDGLTIVLTTHDLNFVASHLPRIVCLNGVITADGNPREVLTAASLERTYGAPMKVLRDGDRAIVVDADEIRLPSLRSDIGGGSSPDGPGGPGEPPTTPASVGGEGRERDLWP